jgi:hypothetical protein
MIFSVWPAGGGVCGIGFGGAGGVRDVGFGAKGVRDEKTGDFGTIGDGIGICDIGVNDGCAGAFGIGTVALSDSGVISVMVRIGSGLGGIIGALLFSLP